MEIVEDSGTGFAFPFSTLYLGRDTGINKNRIRELAEMDASPALPSGVLQRAAHPTECYPAATGSSSNVLYLAPGIVLRMPPLGPLAEM
jgi:hypothetical protein